MPRWTGWNEDAREALRQYSAAMVRNDTACCLAIEQAYGMYGADPELVLASLAQWAEQDAADDPPAGPSA